MKLSKKVKYILEAVIGLMIAISLTIGGFVLYYMFSSAEVPYFFNHFGLAILLLCVGVIAFVMPIVAHSNARYQDDSRDSIMIIVAGLCVLFAILSVILSYLGIGFYSFLA